MAPLWLMGKKDLEDVIAVLRNAALTTENVPLNQCAIRVWISRCARFKANGPLLFVSVGGGGVGGVGAGAGGCVVVVLVFVVVVAAAAAAAAAVVEMVHPHVCLRTAAPIRTQWSLKSKAYRSVFVPFLKAISLRCLPTASRHYIVCKDQFHGSSLGGFLEKSSSRSASHFLKWKSECWLP